MGKVLDRISGYLFFAGFITSKFRLIPIVLVSTIFNLLSSFAYLVGYLTWFVATLFYPEQARKRNFWYGFAEFKDQYQVAALFGLVATIMCLIAPPLIVPTAWLYTISNAIWAISERHKKENPPADDENYSDARQAIYLRYTLYVTASSVVTAIAASLALVFPATTFVLITGSSIIGVGLTIASLYYWGKCAVGVFPPDKVGHSYNGVSKQLSFELVDLPKLDIAPKLIQGEGPPLFAPASVAKNDDDEPARLYTRRPRLSGVSM